MQEASILDHLGPRASSAPIAAIFEINKLAWQQYRDFLPIPVEEELLSKFLSRRMMHISEVTSATIRANISWDLTHPSMSLLRDRYEQALRFSWLARQPDDGEAEKYRRYFYGKVRSLLKNMPQDARSRLEARFGQVPEWATVPLSKEEQNRLKDWDNLDLRTLATRRDNMPPLSALDLSQDKMADLYDGIYSQFSSVSHFDMLGLELLKARNLKNGSIDFVTEPHWPGLLAIQNCRMDIIQCFECLTTYYGLDVAKQFNKMYVQCLRHAPLISADGPVNSA